jgi:type II secretory pathway pseudopilin PulG
VNLRVRSMVFPAIATAVVAASVIAAIVVLGAPSVQRQRKMDGVRVQNLSLIALSVNGYFTRHKELPADLEALAKQPGYHIARSDPDTGKSYGYQILGATSYRLCADFTGDSATDSPQFFGAYVNVTWAHGQGHQCFDRDTEKTIQ